MATLRNLIGGLLACALLLGCADSAEARRRHHHRHRSRVVVTQPAFVSPTVVGAPVVYRTYTTYDPYYRSGYRYYDRDGYRYYRGRDNNVLGRVVLRAIGSALR